MASQGRSGYRNAAYAKRARTAKKAKHLVCVRCDEEKPEGDFVNDRTRTSGKFPWCKPCVLHYRQKSRETPYVAPLTLSVADRICPVCDSSLEGAHPNREYCGDKCKGRARNWRTFGFCPSEFRELVAAQNGRCPICENNVKRWAIDHNHDTMETTGVTCQTCNQSLLAYSKHNPEIAKRLLRYLESPPAREMFGEKRYVGPESVSQLDRMWGWTRDRERRAA